MRDFTKTKAALVKYDERDAEFQAWCSRLTGQQALALLHEVEECGREVGRCFAEETSDINPQDVAAIVRPGPWLRRTIGLEK